MGDDAEFAGFKQRMNDVGVRKGGQLVFHFGRQGFRAGSHFAGETVTGKIAKKKTHNKRRCRKNGSQRLRRIGIILQQGRGFELNFT